MDCDLGMYVAACFKHFHRWPGSAQASQPLSWQQRLQLLAGTAKACTAHMHQYIQDHTSTYAPFQDDAICCRPKVGAGRSSNPCPVMPCQGAFDTPARLWGRTPCSPCCCCCASHISVIYLYKPCFVQVQLCPLRTPSYGNWHCPVHNPRCWSGDVEIPCIRTVVSTVCSTGACISCM